MADDADITADRDEAEAPQRIEASKKPKGPAAIGKCLCCDTALPKGVRWCNAECRDDWEKDEFAYSQRVTE